MNEALKELIEASQKARIPSAEREAQRRSFAFGNTHFENELITREIGRGIPPGRIVLAGFSQGGAVSLYTVPRLTQKLAGVMALSCYLPRESTFQAERAPANDATPIFMAHGLFDGVVPLTLGVKSREYLKALGYKVEWHEYSMAHAVCAEEVADIRQFLVRVLP